MGLMIAGVSSGSGKTTLTIGLMRALKNRGLNIAAFKAGPDYIDPMFHRLAIQDKSYNLPAWMISSDALRYLYNKRSLNKDISIIEGVMGYFDGHSFESIEGSSADLAKTLDIGVIIVMDASSMALTSAAIIEGLLKFNTPSQIKGVIFNKIRTDHHYNLLKSAVETHLDIKCYGYLRPSEEVLLESRHLGLIQAGEDNYIEEKIDKMAFLVEETINVSEIIMDFRNDIDQMDSNTYDYIEFLNKFYDEKFVKLRKIVLNKGRLVLGIAQDEAFSFYYDENIELISELGIELKIFSPLRDKKLPKGIDGLYIGGGYPEVFAALLSENKSMRTDILSSALNGMPIYAECGGLMYLMESLEVAKDTSYEMVGIFDGAAKMTDSLQRFGHVEAELNLNVAGKSTSVLYRAHEFHHSIIESVNNACAINVTGKRASWKCGFNKKNTLATYVHNHFYSNLDFVVFLIGFYSQNK